VSGLRSGYAEAEGGGGGKKHSERSSLREGPFKEMEPLYLAQHKEVELLKHRKGT
jgi:hypothetical protein